MKFLEKLFGIEMDDKPKKVRKSTKKATKACSTTTKRKTACSNTSTKSKKTTKKKS